MHSITHTKFERAANPKQKILEKMLKHATKLIPSLRIMSLTIILPLVSFLWGPNAMDVIQDFPIYIFSGLDTQFLSN